MSKAKTWRDSVLQVLRESGQAVHYKDIPEKITEKGLRKLTGEIPEKTVAGILHGLVKEGNLVMAEGSGMYRFIADGADIHNQESSAQSDRDLKYATFASYGLYWKRDCVNWHKSHLWGREKATSTMRVDFSEQVGVYLLHSHGRIMYVGQTNESRKREGAKGLFERLNYHRRDNRKMHRWDAFSWFGFRELNASGKLVRKQIPSCEARELIDILEAVLIQVILPPLNNQDGKNLGTMYQQVEK